MDTKYISSSKISFRRNIVLKDTRGEIENIKLKDIFGDGVDAYSARRNKGQPKHIGLFFSLHGRYKEVPLVNKTIFFLNVSKDRD